MSATIDSLQIEISSSAQQAQSGIDALTASLEKLQKATESSASLSKLGKQLEAFGTSISSINAMSVSTLTQLGAALNSLRGVEDIKISSTIGKQLSEIATAGSNISTETIVNLQMLAPALQSLSSIRDVQIPSTLGTGISNIATAVSQINVSELSRINELANAIASLANIQNVRLSSSLATQIINLGVAAEQLQGIDLTVFGNLAEALHPLSQLGDVSALASTIEQLNRLPEIVSTLNGTDLSAFTTNIQTLATALAPLAQQMNSIATGFSSLPAGVQQCAQATQTMAQTNNTAANSFTELHSAIQIVKSAINAVLGTISKCVQSSNEYIEDINLFNASLGSYAQQAQQYAEQVSQVMGIDPAKWMRSQGVFYNLADGFGIASDRAYTMSQQLTQLSYDLSSFYNISAEDAMLKVRGGLSGEIEMMRQLGVDLSNAAMQEKATALGIQTKVTAMTQAEKAQLRYIIMMERTTTAQGDMARTLDAPANQLRVLSAQVTQAGRAFGNIFIPALNNILPVVIAATSAITKLLSAIAALFGYKMTSVDYSSSVDSTTSSVDDLTDSLDSAGGSAKQLKSYMMGFDELNVIDPNQGGGGGGGSSGSATDGLDFDLETYDFLGDAINSRVSEFTTLFEPIITFLTDHLNAVLSTVTSIGLTMLGWKIAKTLNPSLAKSIGYLKDIASYALAGLVIAVTLQFAYENTKNYLNTGDITNIGADAISTALGAWLAGTIIGGVTKSSTAGWYTAGITLALSAAVSLVPLYNDIKENGFDAEALISALWDVIKGALAGGAIAIALGTSVVGGLTVGGIITATVALTVVLIALTVHFSEKQKEIMWGKMQLEADEVEKVAKSMFTVDVDTVVNLADAQINDEQTARDNLNSKITTFMTGINKIKLGVEVSEEEITALTNSITGEDGIVAQIAKTLAEQGETVELAVSLVPPTTTSGEDMSGDLLTAMGLGESAINTAASSIGQRLATAMREGYLSHWQNGEQTIVAELSNSLNRISTAVANGQVAGKFSANTELLLTNLTRESFTDVLTQYQELEDELRTSYESLETQAKADAIAYQAGLTEAKAYYESIGDTENLAQVEQALAAITEQIEQWDVGASVDAAVDAATTEGRAKLLEAVRTIFAQPFGDSIDISSLITKSLTISGTWDTDFEELVKSFPAQLELFIINSMTDEDSKVYLQARDLLGVSDWDMLSDEIKTSMYNSVVDAVGDEKAKQLFDALGYDIPSAIAESIEENQALIENAVGGTLDGVDGVDAGTTFVTDVVDTMTAGQDDITAAADTATSEVKSTVETTLGEAETQMTDTATNVGKALETNVVDTVDNAEEKVETMSKTMDETVKTTKEDVSAVFLSLSDSVVAMMHGAYTSVTTEWAGLSAWFTQRVTTPIPNLFSTVKNAITTSFRTAKTSVQNAWSGMGTWFKTNVVGKMKSGLTDGWETAGETAMNEFIKGLKAITLPNFRITLVNQEQTVNGEKVTLQVPKLEFYAAGGFPTSGQMFVAREAGAEMVGSIGGRTAVANNDQIVEAVSQGVYMAVRDAMNEGSNDANVTVYLDGEVVYRNQQKVAQKKGYSFTR